MNDGSGLPDGWCWTSLAHCCLRITDGTHQPPKFVDQGIPFIFVQHIVHGALSFKNTKFISEATYRQLTSRCKVEPGDILYSAVGSYGVAVPVNTTQPFSFQRHIAHLKPHRQLSQSYLVHYLNSPACRSRANQVARGVAQKTVTLGELARFQVPLAPLTEQHRIVAAIEQQFTRLDAGVAALKRAQAALKRYRAAVLKAAVEGKLTEAWWAAHRDVEPASKLLERILAERRAKWEADLRAKGKDPSKTRYVEPQRPNTTDLPGLPEGWCWTTMGALTVYGPQNGLYLPQSAYGVGIPILRIDDFQNGFSRPSSDLRRVQAKPDEELIYALKEGDIIINRVNSPSHLGKCMLVTDRNVPALYESNMMRLRTSQQVEAEFITLYLHSETGKQRLTSNAKWAVNQASINQKDVVATPVPLPPVREQIQIVMEVSQRLSVVGELEATIEHNLKRAERLRQSILERAFSGQLVPQDPNDEPANVLLERIRRERERENGKPQEKLRVVSEVGTGALPASIPLWNEI